MDLAAATTEIEDFFENAVAEAGKVIGFVNSTIVAIEGSGKSGADKLQAVLQSTEVFVNQIAPQAIADVQAFMEAVAAFVNAIVALYNQVGIFVNGVAETLGIGQ